MTALPASDIAAIRSIKKSAIFILCLMRIARPTTAKELAAVLDTDYETTRKHLHSLAQIGIATETRHGWILTLHGWSLFFEDDTLYPQPVESAEKPRLNIKNSAEKPRLTLTTTTTTIGGTQEHEAVVAANIKNSAEKPRLNIKNSAEKPRLVEPQLIDPEEAAAIAAALDALRTYGVNDTPAIQRMVTDCSWIDEDYIHAQAERLSNEGRLSTSLLIHVCKNHDPMPLTKEEHKARSWQRSTQQYPGYD